MLEHGYIKLHRSLLNWEWYGDLHTKAVFLHLLLTVNIADGNWRGVPVKRGQRIYSRASLAQEIGITEKNLRTALAHLKKTGEVANLSTPQYSMITVLNYDKYQEGTSQKASEGPTMGQPRANDGPGNKKAIEELEEREYIPPIVPPGTACGAEQGESLTVKMAGMAAGKPREQPSTTLVMQRFTEFWTAYPNKTGKGAAEKAWVKIRPDKALFEKIMAALERAKVSEQWRRENGRYRPNPATWLNQRRWEDEYPEPDKKGGSNRATSYDLAEFERMMMQRAPGNTPGR